MEALLKKILGIDRVFTRRTWAGVFYDTFFLVLAAFLIPLIASLILSDFIYYSYHTEHVLRSLWLTMILIVVFMMARELIKSIYVTWLLRSRVYKIEKPRPMSNIYFSATNTELDNVDEVHVLDNEGPAQLIDVTFNFNRKTKHGEFLARQAFYTVAEFRLQRRVPHILFDSLQSKGKQFKKLFIQAQRLSLDVDMDDYFEAYAPDTYHIDTLSFITPEVLQNMKQLRDFDIELVGDSLLCYAPLLPEEELQAFYDQSRKLYESLNDNLNAYRDDRLEGDERENGVTPFARQLLESTRRYILPTIVSVIATLVGLWLAFTKGMDARFVIYPALFAFGYITKIVSILRNNAKKRASLMQQYKSKVKHKVVTTEGIV